MPNRSSVLKLFGFFVLAYAIFLPSWLLIKDSYNRTVTELSFRGAAWKYDLHVTHSSMNGRDITFSISNSTPILGPKGMMKPFIIDLSLDVESVTFNVPMTLSLITALILTFGGTGREKLRLALLGMGALLTLHLITLSVIAASLFAGTTETSPLMQFYLSRFALPVTFLENLGMLLNSYAARFEPFLIAILIWWQLSSKVSEETVEPLARF